MKLEQGLKETMSMPESPEAPPPSESPALRISDLTVTFEGQAGSVVAVNNLSLTLRAGQMMAVVGESGSGKTTLTSAVLGLLPIDAAKRTIEIGGHDVLAATAAELRDLRRHDVAVVLQDPVGSLNPVRKIGSQLSESAKAAGHRKRSDRAAAVTEVLSDVGLSEAVSDRFPHELSGGMNQRVTIAMALLKRPKLLIADEATSALDVRTQASVVGLLRKVSVDYGAAVLVVTHDIGLALQACDRVAVMYAGRLVEERSARDFVDEAVHPYSRVLLAATPQFGKGNPRAVPIPGSFRVTRPGDTGCPFRNRCPVVVQDCESKFPPAVTTESGSAWCWKV